MKESFSIKCRFPVHPTKIYYAWLDSEEHSAMTGGAATCSNKIGADFMAWDGYISGSNIELVENLRIVQSWRTVEFDASDEDSLLTVELKEVDGGTELTLSHSHIPEGQTQYEQGWVDNYFVPMKDYFNQLS